MRIKKNFECATDDVQVGWFNPTTEEWCSLEDDDADEQIKALIKRKDAPEIILRSLTGFAESIREALNADLKELYERSAKD